MRKPRFLLPPGGIYHVSTHALETGPDYPFPDLEKERLVRLLKPMAAFSGLNVLTYAFMGNHLHLFLEVPKRPKFLNEKTVIERLNALPKAPSARRKPGDQLAFELSILRKTGMPETKIEARLGQIRERMYDLSRFMQEYLSRYTQDYNRRHDRKGPLWQERFHSTAVQAHRRSLLSVAAYIDLNPLRAGLCEDPKNYRFTGYSAALGGDAFALKGLRRIFELCGISKKVESSRGILSAYRVLLYGKASLERKNKIHFNKEVVEKVAAVGGELGLRRTLTHRHHFLSRGGILGTRIYVEDQLTRWKEKSGLLGKPSPSAQDSIEGVFYGHALQVPL